MLYVPFPSSFSHGPSRRAGDHRRPGRFRGWFLRVALLLLIALPSGLLLSSCDTGRPDGSAATVRELPLPDDAPREWPRLTRDGDRVVLSWLEAVDGDEFALRFASVDSTGPGRPGTIARSDHFFRNWADFPSVVPVGDSLLLAHWLLRGPTGGYDYGIRVATSRDGGETWSAPKIPHTDDTPTEHGFVTFFPLQDGGRGLVWLDGRHFDEVADPQEARMSLRFRTVGADGFQGPEVALDLSVCDCCQTDAALTAQGPVVVYRDRTPDEVRDISILRRVDGAWTDPQPVHEDGWVIPACPVNGPAIAARDELVAVAWFTAADDRPAVKVAFSRDGGASFGDPIRLDRGDPVGRVDVELLGPREAVVSWLERAGQSAEIRLRRVGPGGESGASRAIASSSGERASGFPRMVLAPWGELMLTWNEPSSSRIRLVALNPGTLSGLGTGAGDR